MTNQRGATRLLIITIILMAVGAVALVMKFRTTSTPADIVDSVDISTPEREDEVPCGDFTQPRSGSIVASGSEVPLVVDFKDKVWDTIELFSDGPGDPGTLDPATGRGVLRIPNTASGSMKFTLVGVKGKDTICSGGSLVLLVRPSAKITKLYVIPDKVYLGPNDTKQLLVGAVYDDGVDRSASSPIVGTTYTSLHPSIATVDQEGLVTGRTIGPTNITVQNGKLFKNITVVVFETTESE